MNVIALELALAKAEIEYQTKVRALREACRHVYPNGETALNRIDDSMVCVGCGQWFHKKDSKNS